MPYWPNWMNGCGQTTQKHNGIKGTVKLMQVKNEHISPNAKWLQNEQLRQKAFKNRHFCTWAILLFISQRGDNQLRKAMNYRKAQSALYKVAL
jgi:hypothetical protein